MPSKDKALRAEIKEVMEDFDDFDTEIEQISEHEFAEMYQEALNAAMGEIKAMLELPLKSTLEDRKVQVIIERAVRRFNVTWTKRAHKLLSREIESGMRRGVLLCGVMTEQIGEQNGEK